VSSLCREYLESADSPQHGRERERAAEAIDLLLEHHPTVTVADFGPNDLRAWQAWLCGLKNADDPDRTRFNVTSVNYMVDVIRRVFAWGVSTERVAEGKLVALRTVPRPKPGEARPPRIVEPADPEAVKKTLPYLRPPVRAMVVLQLTTGARPGELCKMKAGDVTRAGKLHIPGAGVQDLDKLEVWAYVPSKHKLTWKGKPRFLLFAPDAQRVLAPFLDRDAAAYCFSPRESTDGLRAEQRAARKSKVQPSQANRKKVNPQKQPGLQYNHRSYNQAVRKACVKAGVAHWFPYQLRHLAAAEVKAVFGLDAVQALLGHHTRTMAEHYGGVAVRTAAEVAKKRAGSN
ncbi:MAG TPA: site-specific integrase, partial [Gemmataceae bacterium]|nr:site-specific integrase [Gemmataceae bacterium]